MQPTLLIASGVALVSGIALAQIPSPSPQARSAPRAEYIATTGVGGVVPANRHWSHAAGNGTSMFVFGGRNGTGAGPVRNDLQEFDATTLTWTEHNADGDPLAPAPRYRNGIAWDALTSKLIVFGGEDGAGNILGDTWQWDPVTNSWANISPALSPSARRFSAMAQEPSTGGLLLFGGWDVNDTPLNDTWLFIGGTWIQLNPATSPPARGHHSLVTRDNFGDVFLCAGHDGAATGRIHFLDSWRWDGPNATWVQINPTTTAVPHGVAGNQAVYDPLRSRVVLTGGQGISTAAGNTGGAYGTEYGGSPSAWTSEFDCVTNEWLLYGPAAFSTADPVIGRASRYYSAFIPAAGKIYFWGGQNPSGTGTPLTDMKEYQAAPVASVASYGAGCSGLVLAADSDPWLGRTFESTLTGLSAGSLVWGITGFTTAATPLATLHPAGGAGCDLLMVPDGTLFLLNIGGSAEFDLALPSSIVFAGAAMHMQGLQVTVNGAGTVITSLTSSNGITITAGAL